MGIPRLAKQLHAFSEFSALGCKSIGCEEHPCNKKIIIDGPSLAYHIYRCGLAHSPSSLGIVDAIPSYDGLGQATLAFLDELQCHGATVEHIFFDGAISKDKEEVRKSRLQAYTKKLVFARETCLSGLAVSMETAIIPATAPGAFFDSARPVSINHNALPPSTFLVPAVLDALRTSKWASITSVVPGEADVFCARAALEPRRTILTNDSDLLLYDLGPSSEVVFLKDLELRSSHETLSKCDTLYARVSHPSKIASRLGLRGLRRLAFEIREDSSINLQNAISRAKQPVGSLALGSSMVRMEAFEKLDKAYNSTFSGFEAITMAGMTFATDVSHGSFLDPRVSELVARTPYPSSIFLPSLTDDASRSSAWDVSRKLRYFTYSCLVFKNSDTFLEHVSEYVRRGARIVEDDVSLLEKEESIQYASALATKLEKFESFLEGFSTQTIWRPYALCEVFGWYVDSGKELPSKDTLIAAFSGTTNDKQLSWKEVHVSAQLQGYLYSLRMLHQILSHLILDAQEKIKAGKPVRKGTLIENPSGLSSYLTYRHEHAKQLPAELLKLHEILSTLPLLGELIPSRLELITARAMPALEFEYLLDVIFTSIHEYSDDDEEGSMTSNGDGKATNATVSEDLDEMPKLLEPRKEDSDDGEEGNITSKGDGKAIITTVSEDLDEMAPQLLEPRKEDSDNGQEGNITSKGDGKATITTVSEDLDRMPPKQMEPRNETHFIGVSKPIDGNDRQKGQDKNNRFYVLGSE